MAPQIDIGMASLTLPQQNPEIATEEPPEWLLWAKRQRKETEKVCERIRDLEKSQVDSTSSIRGLEKELQQGSAKYTALEQRHNQFLGTSIQMSQRTDALEQGVKALDSKCNMIAEQFRALEGAIHTTSKTHEEKFHQVLANIKEREGSSEDIIQWRQTTDATHEKLRHEVNNLKLKIGEAVAKLQDRQSTVPHRCPSKPLSEATTVDQQIETRPDTGRSNEDALQEELDMLPQQKLSLEEYLNYGKNFIDKAMEAHEKKVVKAFVQGLREKHRCTSLEKRLEQKGWTWTSASKEIADMVEASKRIKKNNTLRRQNALAGLPP